MSPLRHAPIPEVGSGLGRGRLLLLPLLVWALWRTTLGVDLNDGGVAVALAMRLARGDVLFADEMAPQALGALPAVPFTWLWLTVVGTEGIVLASRVFFVLGCVLVAWLADRAWRSAGVPAWPALGAAVVPLIPMAYNLPVLGYNTVPGLAGVLAVATGYAAVVRGHPGPAAVCGLSCVVMALAHPAAGPGAALLLASALLLTRAARVRGALVLGAAVPVVLGLVWVLLVPGWSALWASVRYGSAVQESRPGVLEQAGNTVSWYAGNVPGWLWGPALAGSVLAALLGRRLLWTRLLVVGAPLVVAVGLLAPDAARALPSGSAGVVLGLLLLLPALSWAGERRDVGRIGLVLGVPGGLLAGLALTLTTASGAGWGAGVTGLAPALAAITLAVVQGLSRLGQPVAVAGLTLLIGVLAAAHTATVYRNGGPGDLVARVAAGPNAGLATTACYAELDAAVGARFPQDPRVGVLVYGMGGAYAHAQGPMDTTRLWITDFGAANGVVVEWIDATGRRPGVALIALSEVRVSGDLEALAASDPLIAWLVSGYGEPVQAGPFLAFVDPTAPAAEELRAGLAQLPPAVTDDAGARERALDQRC